MFFFPIPGLPSCRFVALSFDLQSLVQTSIFRTAASDLLIQLSDSTPVSPLLPGEDQLPFYRDVDPRLVAVTSSSDGVVRNAAPTEVRDVLDSAGDQFTTIAVLYCRCGRVVLGSFLELSAPTSATCLLKRYQSQASAWNSRLICSNCCPVVPDRACASVSVT